MPNPNRTVDALADILASLQGLPMAGRQPRDLQAYTVLEQIASAVGQMSVNPKIGAIYYVDPNGGSNLNDGLDQNHAFSTVAYALTKCRVQRGDTVAILPNNAWQDHNHADGRLLAVSEEVTIEVPGVNIIGISPSPLGVEWAPASNGGTCIKVHAMDTLIAGILFTEGNFFTGVKGIDAKWTGVTEWADNLAVYNCHFDRCTVGIEMDYVWYGKIIANRFQNCGRAIYCNIANSSAGYMQILGNIIHAATGYCISMQDCDDNIIANNHIWQEECITVAAGATDKGIDLATGARNLVEGNFLSCKLPVPADGDYNDMNTAGTNDAWINNHCLNGDAVTNPT